MKLLIVVDANDYRAAMPPTMRSLVFESSLLVAVSEAGVWRIDRDVTGALPDHMTPEELAKAIKPGD